MIVIALGAGVMGWFLPAGSTFTRAVADALYCSVSSANCSSLYCTASGPGFGSGSNCITNGGPCIDHIGVQKTAAQTVSSTTFTTYTHSSGWTFSPAQTFACSGLQGFGLGYFLCTTSFQYKVNSTSVLASFQLTDIGGVPVSGSSATYQAQEAASTGTIPLSLDNTQATNTVPNADTNLKTYSLATNTYQNVIVVAEGYVNFAVTSTAQVINIKLKYGATQIGSTVQVDGAVALAQSIPFTITGSAVQTASATLAVTDGAAAADGNTNVFLNNLFVYANYASTTTLHLGSITWRGFSSNAAGLPDIALQAKVSGANMAVTLNAANIACVNESGADTYPGTLG